MKWEIKSLLNIMSLLNENYIKFFQSLMSFLGLKEVSEK